MRRRSGTPPPAHRRRHPRGPRSLRSRRPTEAGNPAWPGSQPPQAPPPANPAWPGSQPTQPTTPSQVPPPLPPAQPGPGWGGPGVPPQQQPYPPGAASQGWQHGAPWAPPKNDGLAVGALVTGILAGLCGLAGIAGILFGPVALGLGISSRRRIANSNGMLRGDGLALTGIVLGAIGTVVSVFWLVLLIANPDLLQNLIDRVTTTTTAGG